MFGVLEALIFTAQSFIAALFCYSLSDTKVSKAKAILIYCGYMLVFYILCFYKITPEFEIERRVMPIYFRTMVGGGALFIYIFKILKTTIKRTMFIMFFYYFVYFSGDIIATLIVNFSIQNIFSFNIPENIYELSHMRVFVISIASIVFFCSFYIGIILSSKFNKTIKKLLVLLFIILPISQIIITIGLYNSKNSAVSSYGIIFTLTMVIVDFILFNLIEYFNGLVEKETEVVKLNSERENLYNYYKLTQDKANEVSKIKHDLKNQIQTAILLLEDDEKASPSINFLSKIDAKIDDVDRVTYCSNQIINTVLSIKSAEAKKYGINSNIKISNIDNITIDDIDLSSIFSNLYDNSIEALKNTNIIDKYIDISVLANKGYLVIRFINPINRNIKVYNKNKVETTKQDKENHGFGLKQINSITKKYDGDVEILTDNEKFQITLYLKN